MVEEPNFIKGDLSTDYLDRFNLMDKMHENAKNRIQRLSSAALAAALLQSEYVKTGATSSRTSTSNTTAAAASSGATRSYDTRRPSWNRPYNGRRSANAI
jgi:hypothetical protein